MSEDKKRAMVLNPNRFLLAEAARNVWIANAEEGTTIQDIMEPSYWSHKASVLRPYDHVEVRLETGEWVAEVLVVSQGLNWAKVHLLHKHDIGLSADEPPESQKYRVKWRGQHHKYCVIRIADNECLQTGMEKRQAEDWLRHHERLVSVT